MEKVNIPLYVVRDNQGFYLHGQKKWVDTLEEASIQTRFGSAQRFISLLTPWFQNWESDKLPLRIEQLNVTSKEVVDLTKVIKKGKK